MSHGPEFAMDYPSLPDDTWVIWSGNEHVWPDARRELRYLSSSQTHILKGYALWTDYDDGAMTFATREEAEAELARQEDLRGHIIPYAKIATIADIKRLRFPSEWVRGLNS